MNTTMKKSILGAAMSAALGFGSFAHAGVVVDLFTDPVGSEQVVATSTLNATVSDQNAVAFPTASVVGAYRDLSIKKTADVVGGPDGESRLAAGFGALTLDNATGNKSIGVITWDGSNNAGALGTAVSSTGLGGVDFTAGAADRFLATVIAADLGFDYQIRVWDMDGSQATLSASFQFLVDPPGEEAGYEFSWFNLADGTYCDGVASPPVCADPTTQLDFSILRGGNLGAIDFTKIGALQIEFTNANAFSADFAIGNIASVPEPGALALVGIALVGAAVAGRQRKASKA